MPTRMTLANGNPENKLKQKTNDHFTLIKLRIINYIYVKCM